jgi:hypothetical protein
VSSLSLVSTVQGLGTAGYVSTLSLVSTVQGLGTAGYVSSLSLVSTVQGLGTAGYISSIGPEVVSTVQGLGTAGYVSTLSLVSTVQGLGTAGYISSLSLESTVIGLRNNFSSLAGVFSSIGVGCNLPAYTLDVNGSINANIMYATTQIYVNGKTVLTTAGGNGVYESELVSTVQGLGRAGYVSSLSLVSTVQGLGTAGYVSSLSLVSTVQGLGTAGYISSIGPEVVSTVQGLGTAGYVSTLSLVSTVQGLGTAGYISTLSLISTVQGLRTNFSSLAGNFSSIGIGCNLPAYALDVNGYVNIKGPPSYGNLRIQGTSAETGIMIMDPTNNPGAVSGWFVGESTGFGGSASTINMGRINNNGVASPAAISINSNGNVGIGINPVNFNTLTVNGRISLSNTGDLYMMTTAGIYDSVLGGYKIRFGTGPGDTTVLHYGSSHNFFAANSVQYAYINGTEIYSYNNITAVGKVSAANVQFVAGGGLLDVNNTQRLRISVGATQSNVHNADVHWFRSLNNATPFATVDINGVYSYYDVIAASDKRYKENIMTISNATSIINNLRGVYYNRKDDEKEIKTRKVGLIAQETEEALPEVVHTDSTEDAYKSISYGNIVAVLIEGMKEQQSTIKSLQSSFNTLFSQFSTLVG